MQQKLISQGAEARIYEAEIASSDKEKNNNGNNRVIIKDRFRKTYRHEALDKQLRSFRARREAKVLEKLKSLNFLVPKVIELDDKNSKLVLEKIDGRLVKEFICSNEKDKKLIARLGKQIGEKIAFLHLHDIIHSDLTTSNLVYSEPNKHNKSAKTNNTTTNNNTKTNNNNNKINNPTNLGNNIYFIDFGLSYFSTKIEDKAVDLHLIERAFESKHYRIFKQCFKAVVEGYLKIYTAAGKKEIGNQILARFELVKERGRNKAKNAGS